MACYGGLKGILSGLTKSTDHPSSYREPISGSGSSALASAACSWDWPLCGQTIIPRERLLCGTPRQLRQVWVAAI